MAKKDFAPKTTKRHHSGIILKPGAANKTDTSFTAKQLVLATQTTERAHLVSSNSIVNSSNNSSSKSVNANTGDMESKEWRAMVRLACAHCGHHAAKARRDAWDRLKRLLALDHFHAKSSTMAGIHSLLLDTFLRGWCDEDEAVRKSALLVTKTHLPELLATARHDGFVRRLECGLLVALSHVRPECRLAGRTVLATCLLDARDNSVLGENVPYLWSLMDNLLLHMRLMSAQDVSSKPTDVHVLMPRLLRLLVSPTVPCNAPDALQYTWQPEQNTSLALIRLPTHKRSTNGRHPTNTTAYHCTLQRFMSKLTLLWPFATTTTADTHPQVKPYLTHVCRLIRLVGARFGLGEGVIPVEAASLLGGE